MGSARHVDLKGMVEKKANMVLFAIAHSQTPPNRCAVNPTFVFREEVIEGFINVF